MVGFVGCCVLVTIVTLWWVGLLIVCVWRCVVVALGDDYVALRYDYWFRLVWVYCYSSVV